MALSKEYTEQISEAAESFVAEAEADVDGTADQVDAGDAKEEGDVENGVEGNSEANADSEERTGDSESGEERHKAESASEGDGGAVQGEADGGQVAPAVKPKSPPAPVRDPEVFARAIRAGMSSADVQDFPNDAVLERACSVLERIPVAAQAEAKEGPDPLAKFENLDPDQYDEETISAFGGLAKEIREQRERIKELQENQQQGAQANAASAAREVEQWFDGQVSGLGEDYAEVLGTGAHSALDRSGQQYAKREEIAGEVTVLLAGLQATGRPIPPRDELFKKAVGLVLREEMAGMREKKLKGKLDKRGRQHVSRAGRREEKPSSETPEEETAALLSKKFNFGDDK